MQKGLEEVVGLAERFRALRTEPRISVDHITKPVLQLDRWHGAAHSQEFSLDIPGIDPALPAANACTFALKDGNEDSDHK